MTLQRIIVMLCLVIAGEAVFSLPFHVTRYFRPTFLEVFGWTNLELGKAQAIYGVVAMLAYFPGGPLADYFSARKLLSISLLSTSFGGLLMATIPDQQTMALCWGFWGLTSILLFWAALIRATRDWGGSDAQGQAFGLLDGGRGLFAAILAFACVAFFDFLMPEDVQNVSAIERRHALSMIIYTYTALTMAAAVFVWFAIPESKQQEESQEKPPIVQTLLTLMKIPTLWLQALIVISAYVGYKGTDYFSLYAVDVYGMDEVKAAQVGAMAAWIRPIAALLAGLLADRLLSSRVVAGCFALLVLVYGAMGILEPTPSAVWLLFAQIILICIAVYGLRGVYFALFEEGGVPAAVTGSAAGIVSVIGYTPDIFVAPCAGYLLDTWPGVQGHQYLLLFLMGFTCIGLLASIGFGVLAKKAKA